MNARLTVLLVASIATASAAAGPLRPQRVDADAAWFMHIDVERLTTSSIGGFLIDNADDLEVDINDVKEELGIDPVQDIFGVTIYGDQHPEDDATVVLEMSAVVDEVIEQIEDAEGYERIVIDDHVIHGWNDGRATYAHVISTADPERRIVVMGGSSDRVVKAADVVEGRRRSLADALRDDDRPADDDVLPSEGSIAYAFSRGLPWVEPGDDPASAIVSRSDRLRLELREDDGTTTVDVLISARNESDARNITDVLRGVIALGELLSEQEPGLEPLQDLARGLTVTGESNDVRVVLRVDSNELQRCLDDVVGALD